MIGVHHHYKLFPSQRALRPDIVCGKNAKLLHPQTLKNVFYILRIKMFLPSAVTIMFFLRPTSLQVPGDVHMAEIARHQPSVYNRFCGHLGIVEIMRHYGSAANGDSPIPSGPGSEIRTASRAMVCPRCPGGRPEIIYGDSCACLRATVTVRNLASKIVEQFERRSVGERASHEQ